VRISFKLPFDNPDMQKKCVSPYFAFNPYKENQNGKQIYKSPLLKTRKFKIIYIFRGVQHAIERSDEENHGRV